MNRISDISSIGREESNSGFSSVVSVLAAMSGNETTLNNYSVENNSDRQNIPNEPTMRSLLGKAYQRVKIWESEFETRMLNHKNICDRSHNALKERISILEEDLKSFKAKFDNILLQIRAQPKFQCSTRTLKEYERPRSLLFTKVTKECEDFYMHHINKYEVLGDFIKKNIIEEIIEKEAKKFRTIDSEIKKYEANKRKLEEKEEKKSESQKTYEGLVNQILKGKKIKKDIYVAEMNLIETAREEWSAMKELGAYIAELIGKIQNYELEVLGRLKEAIDLFTKKMSELFGENNHEIFQTLAQISKEEEIIKFYSLENLVGEQEINLMDESLNRSELEGTLDLLITYLENPADLLRIVSASPWILYTDNVFVQAENKILGEEPSKICITVQKSIIVNSPGEKLRVIKINADDFTDADICSNSLTFFEKKSKSFMTPTKYEIIFESTERKKIFIENIAWISEDKNILSLFDETESCLAV